MRILKAIAKALVAMTVMVAVWVESLARFVIRCMPGYQRPEPGDLMEEYVAMGETDAPAAVSEVDQRVSNIQSIARALTWGQPVRDEWLVGISERTTDWLGTMTPEMLVAVAAASPDALREHMAGRKSIKGLLAFDPEAVAAYQAAVARDAEPELEYHRRRPRRQDVPMPAFGPMC